MTIVNDNGIIIILIDSYVITIVCESNVAVIFNFVACDLIIHIKLPLLVYYSQF